MSVVESVMSRDISKANGHTISVDPVAVNAGSWCHTFTKPGVHPFDEIEWKIVDASIVGSGGKKVFEAKNIEVPGWWETNTINIVADKYFRVVSGQRETSVKQVFARVASTIRKWADEQGYFNSKDDAHVYEMELIYALLHQYGAFNSPVWFNLGIPGRRQAASACFISSVDDTLDSIMEFQKAESVIFAGGSGSGANLSKIRSSYEKLASGSYTSGPLSWMRGLDQYAMAMKSGGSCLAPYQKVYTSSGPISVKELADSRSEFVVLSWDPPANRYKAKKATAWHAGTKEVIRINTDKGSFDFSIDHPFKLSTGKFVRADELKVGMSLFSCAINKNDGGYLRVNLKDGKKGKELLHRMVAKDVSGSDTYRMSVHHKDGNKYNNAPDNLECMTDSEHITEHSKKLVEDGVHTFQTRKFPKIGSSNPMYRDSQFWKDAARVESYRKSKSDQLMGSGLAKEMQKLAASEKMLKTGYEIINSGGDVSSFEAFAKSRKTIVGKFASKKRLLESINNRFGSYGNYVNELSINNHRIVSIESVGTMDVYDVNVQCPTEDDKSVNTGHNFVVWSGDDLVGSGVVVANTRNAAKMVILDMDHPDIIETKDGRPGFVRCKAEEEILAHKLVGVGISAAYDDPNGAYKRVMFQNANHSVSIPDAFMQAVVDDGEWVTKERLTDEAVHTYKARDVWSEISKAAWVCGDPGVQFRDTINRWHTIPKTGPIVASNPCFAAETKIATEFGLVTISELYERIQDGQVNVSVHTGETIVSRPAIIFPTGINPILKIEFKSGRILNVTPNHTFLLRDGSRKPAAELESGDTVDIQCKEGQFGSYDLGLPESQEWYKIAGFMVGDGWMTHIKVDNSYHRKSDDSDQSHKSDRYEAGMCFGKDDKDILAHVTSFLDGNEVKYSLKRQTASVGESPDYLRIGRSGVFKALENVVSPRGCKSFTKRIQPGVFEASRHNQLAFMSGYLSADGTFRLSAKGHGGKIPTREMRLSSVNLELLQDVQALLLNLGIKSTIKQNRIKRSLGSRAFTYTSSNGEEKVYSSTRNCHELFIYGHSLRKLRDGMNEIGGMISSRKQGMLEEHLPSGHSEPVHDVWNDEVVSVSDTGREELTYNMTEFDTHTIIAEGVRIPQCSEYLNVDDSACNLCALNLTKFFDGRQFSVDRFAHATRLFSMAQMAIVGKADYPTEKIRDNSKKLRPIGTNYGDLGALLMKMGYAYDSDEGRVVAARLASIMTGLVYKTSAGIAARVGAFADFEKNKDEMLQVMKMHQEADRQILNRWSVASDPLGQDILSKSAEVWKETLDLGYKYGYSICQATLQAPLGCLVAGSLVSTDQGLLRIEDLGDVNGEKWQDVDFKVQTDDGPRQATKFYINGVDDIIDVTTEHGYKLRGTPKHQIKVVNDIGEWEWRRLDELRPDDVVPLSLDQIIGNPRVIDLPDLPKSLVPGYDRGIRVPSVMNMCLAELCGMFASNGSLHHKGLRLAVYAGDVDVIERYSQYVKDLFGKAPTLTKVGECVSLCVNSTQIKDWWQSAGFAKVSAGNRLEARIPNTILASNDRNIYGAYLRGLYTGDGSTSNGLPSLTNKSATFIREIQSLLMTIGVATRYDQHIGGHSGKPVYRLTVSSSNFNPYFKELIGFAANRKMAKVSDPKKWSNSDYVYIPKDLLEEICPNGSELRKLAVSHIQDGSIPRHLALKLPQDKGGRLKRVMSFYYDKVKSADLQNQEMTYDLSVPGNVTYIANGFVSHNTISFLMGMDTTGIEPAFSLVSYKSMVGGGFMKIVNGATKAALDNLGLSESQVSDVVKFIEDNGTVEGAPHLSPNCYPIFETAMPSGPSGKCITPLGHIKMMAAIQPLITCAQSKTVNLPSTATPEEIGDIYLESWKLGVKCVALYRDGCKASQPLATKARAKEEGTIKDEAKADEPTEVQQKPAEVIPKVEHTTKRRRMPDDVSGWRHKFDLDGYKGYIIVNEYEDGTPGEVFLKLGKPGSTVAGLIDGFTKLLSTGLQHGIPLERLIASFIETRFEPSGMTTNPKVRFAKSLYDYLFKLLDVHYYGGRISGLDHRLQAMSEPSSYKDEISRDVSSEIPVLASSRSVKNIDAPPCPRCGILTQRSGSCYLCTSCGSSTGCS